MRLRLVDASVVLAREDPEDTHRGDAGRLLDGGDALATLDLAFYEVTNVAVRSWRDRAAAHRLRARVAHTSDAQLVSCDVRDLVSRRFACLPGDALHVERE